MTEATIAFLEYLRKVGKEQDADFLREGIQVLTEALMELEISQQIGAERYEHSGGRATYRNSYRERLWQTRVGDVALRIPKVRAGSYFPSFLEARRRPEQALLAVIQQAYIEGVSTRKVDDLVQSLGLSGIDKSAVSRICKQLDEVVEAFRIARLAGWNTGWTYRSSRPEDLCASDQSRPPSSSRKVARRCSFSRTAARKSRG
jgi:transposase-like protein